MSDEEKIQIAALGLLGILGRKPKRRPKSPSPVSPQRSPSPQDSDNDEDGQPRKRSGTPDLLYSGIPSGIPTQDSDNDEDGPPRKRSGTPDLLYSGIPSGIPTPDETDRERAERQRAERLQRDANDDLLRRRNGQPRKRRGALDILTGIPTPDETDRERDERQEAERQQKNRERKAKVEAYSEAFSKYDTDRSGSISLSELAEGYRLAGMGFQSVQEAMDEHDLDGDGSLSFEEFLKWGLDTNALKQWGRDFETAKMAKDAPIAVDDVPPAVDDTVADVDNILRKAIGMTQKRASSGAKPAGKGSQKADLDKMVADYLQKKNLVDGEKYAPLSQDNIGAWKTAVNDFNKDGKRNAMNRVFQGFLKAAAGRDVSAKKYSGKDIYSVDEDGNVKSIFTDGTAQYAYDIITQYLTKGNVPRGASGMVPILNVLMEGWSGGNVEFKQYVPGGTPKPSGAKKKKAGGKTRKKKDAAIDLLNNWAESSSPDNSRSSGDAAGGEDGDKTPGQGTTNSSSSSPSSSGGDEAEEQILLDSNGSPFQSITLGFLAVRRKYTDNMKDKLFRVSNSGGDRIYKVTTVRTFGPSSKPKRGEYTFVRKYESSEDVESVTEFAPRLRF